MKKKILLVAGMMGCGLMQAQDIYNNRSNLDKFMLGKYNEIASKYSTKVFDAKIRQCQKIKEAQVLGQSILQYAPKSNAVTDYTAFVDELIR